MSSLSEHVKNNVTSVIHQSWSLQYRLEYHREFLKESLKSDAKSACETLINLLDCILDPRQSEDSVNAAVKNLQGMVDKNAKDLPATFLLAMCIEDGIGIKKDSEQAIFLYDLLAKAGYVPALNLMAVHFETLADKEKRDLTGPSFTRASDFIDYNRGNEYLDQATGYFKVASDKGYIPAIFNYGRILTASTDLKIQNEGLKLLEKAALSGQAGYACAQIELAEHFENVVANDSDPNHLLAFKFCILAEIQGSPQAKTLMGDFYMVGKSDFIKIDKKLAVEYYIQAASKGDISAQQQLRICYQQGIGVERNAEKAELYRGIATSNPMKKSHIRPIRLNRVVQGDKFVGWEDGYRPTVSMQLNNMMFPPHLQEKIDLSRRKFQEFCEHFVADSLASPVPPLVVLQFQQSGQNLSSVSDSDNKVNQVQRSSENPAPLINPRATIATLPAYNISKCAAVGLLMGLSAGGISFFKNRYNL